MFVDEYLSKRLPRVEKLPRGRKLGIFFLLVAAAFVPWIKVGVDLVVNARPRYQAYTTITNGLVVLPTTYGLWLVVLEGKYSWILDLSFIYFTGVASMRYHFCDLSGDEPERFSQTPWSYCVSRFCFCDAASNAADAPGCCWWLRSSEEYDKLQLMDFAGSYFMVVQSMLVLSCIRPFILRALVYAGVFYRVWISQLQVNRESQENVPFLLFGGAFGLCLVQTLLRLVYLVRAPSPPLPFRSALSFFFLDCVPWFTGVVPTLSLIALGLCGKYKLTPEVGTYESYALPHGLAWHAPMFTACAFIAHIQNTIDDRYLRKMKELRGVGQEMEVDNNADVEKGADKERARREMEGLSGEARFDIVSLAPGDSRL